MPVSFGSALCIDDQSLRSDAVIRHRGRACIARYDLLERRHVGNLQRQRDPVGFARVDKRGDVRGHAREDFLSPRRRKPVGHIINFVSNHKFWHDDFPIVARNGQRL